MKKWMALGVVCCMLCVAVPVLAAGGGKGEQARLRPDYTIVIDGKEMNFKRADGSAAYALVYEDATYLPLRAIGEALGKNVNWNEKTKTITLSGTREDEVSSNEYVSASAKDVTVQVRSDFTIVIDGQEQTFKTSGGKAIYPLLYDGSTYLPLRAIGQIMDKDVAWEQESKTITLTSNQGTVTDADSFSSQTENAATAESETGMGMERAKEIAIQDAGLSGKNVTFLQTKADRENGRKVYEVEFYYDGIKYDYEIDAQTGQILSVDHDAEGYKADKIKADQSSQSNITLEQAKEIAFKHAGVAEDQISKLKTDTDYENGEKIYEIEFKNGRIEYEYEISAATGQILKYEKDVD